jgi:hypothetical protein
VSLSCGQDLLLCGIYGRIEARHGNIDQARKIFDMALSSTEGGTQVPYDQIILFYKSLYIQFQSVLFAM